MTGGRKVQRHGWYRKEQCGKGIRSCEYVGEYYHGRHQSIRVRTVEKNALEYTLVDTH